VRGGGAAPISQKTLNSADLEPRYFGQDVPLVLQGVTPSLTSYAETGNYWGYSYIRLRGIDQSRINLTLDGIPLNDPEDQVLYFADFPDLANSLNSVQVQRGVGTSSNGTAAYAGSINMETIPLTGPRRGNVQLEGGSFGSKRVSAEYQTGLLPSRFAAYARISGLRTEGYR
jgi:iron complex outermembrane receptor protein